MKFSRFVATGTAGAYCLFSFVLLQSVSAQSPAPSSTSTTLPAAESTSTPESSPSPEPSSSPEPSRSPEPEKCEKCEVGALPELPCGDESQEGTTELVDRLDISEGYGLSDVVIPIHPQSGDIINPFGLLAEGTSLFFEEYDAKVPGKEGVVDEPAACELDRICDLSSAFRFDLSSVKYFDIDWGAYFDIEADEMPLMAEVEEIGGGPGIRKFRLTFTAEREVTSNESDFLYWLCESPFSCNYSCPVHEDLFNVEPDYISQRQVLNVTVAEQEALNAQMEKVKYWAVREAYMEALDRGTLVYSEDVLYSTEQWKLVFSTWNNLDEGSIQPSTFARGLAAEFDLSDALEYSVVPTLQGAAWLGEKGLQGLNLGGRAIGDGFQAVGYGAEFVGTQGGYYIGVCWWAKALEGLGWGDRLPEWCRRAPDFPECPDWLLCD